MVVVDRVERSGKLVFNGFDFDELYDLDADLGETHNLAGERPDVVAALEAKLREWEADVASGPMLT